MAPLPAKTRIGLVTLQIADIDRSLVFYRDVIGFRLIARHDASPRVARLGVDGRDDVLLELCERPGAHRVPRRGLIGLYHFAILVPSRADLGRFIVNAANVGARMSSADHLVSEALYLVDPDGITVEVYRDRPRRDWQYSGHELQMASLPLDFDEIVGTVEPGQTWRGLPRDTVMGHMHFYVGDLERAEAFYCGELGFEPTLRTFPGALFVSAGGYHHHVGLNTWAAHMPVATEDDAKLVSWELVVPRGSALAEGPRQDPWGISVRVVHE
jgi:catechol 2,3-dioxygenase